MNPSMKTLLIPGLILVACGGEPVEEPVIAVNIPTASVSDVTPAEWQALGSKRIFFGHQSVGRDLMLGIQRVLEANPEIPLRIVQSDDPNQVYGPALIDVRVGKNREPETKTSAFLAALDNGFGSEAGAVAMYKFCYVDVDHATDPVQLFRDYEAAMEQARRQYPGLTIVHFTMPLHAAGTGIVDIMKSRLGQSTQMRLNVLRSRYNALLRERYADTDPVFDLATLESTRADGSRAFSRFRGETAYMLAPEWTYDGGHLTDEAQDRFAEQLLVFLARLKTESHLKVASSTTTTGGRQ